MVNGLFYGIDGMHVGGTRRLEIAPHLAWGEKGVPGMIPENALVLGGDHDSRGSLMSGPGGSCVWPRIADRNRRWLGWRRVGNMVRLVRVLRFIRIGWMRRTVAIG